MGVIRPPSRAVAGTCEGGVMNIERRNKVKVTGNLLGRTVVLAHGFGCDQNMWRLTVPALEKDYRVVLFDYVGSGRSDLSAFSADRYASWRGTPATWWRSAKRSTCATRSSWATR